MSTAAACEDAQSIDPMDHQRLVHSIAHSFRGRGVDVDDLVQEGQFGLLRACELFEPKKGFQFSTYAAYWIKNFIRAAIRNQSGTVRFPAYIHQAINDGQTPESPELSPKRRACLKAALETRGRKTVGSRDLTEAGLEDLVVDGRESAPDRETLDEVLPLLRALPEREAAILRLRFGLDGEQPLTLRATAERFGLTRERVRQIQAETIDQLRIQLSDRDEDRRIAGVIRKFFPEEQPTMSVQPAVLTGPPKAEANPNACPKCGREYGQRKRCYHCVPGVPLGRPKTIKMEPDPAPIAKPSPARKSDARAELEATNEILAIAERLDAEAARRALGWVSERIQGSSS